MNASLIEGEKYAGVVLGLSTECLTKTIPFGVFQEKLLDFVVTTFTNGGDIIVTIKRVEDTMPLFEQKHKPKTLVDE